MRKRLFSCEYILPAVERQGESGDRSDSLYDDDAAVEGEADEAFSAPPPPPTILPPSSSASPASSPPSAMDTNKIPSPPCPLPSHSLLFKALAANHSSLLASASSNPLSSSSSSNSQLLPPSSSPSDSLSYSSEPTSASTPLTCDSGRLSGSKRSRACSVLSSGLESAEELDFDEDEDFDEDDEFSDDEGMEEGEKMEGVEGGAYRMSPFKRPKLADRLLLPSRYKQVRKLGEGSYGVVFLCEDTVTGEKVAVKKVFNIFQELMDAKRLLRELRILRTLQHSNIIQVRDLLLPPSPEGFNDIYIVFEFVDTDMHKLIASPQYLSCLHVKFFLYQLLKGVKFIHSAKIIHRDLKPANVLVTENCHLKICDFGLSRGLDSTTLRNKQGVHLTKHVVTRWYRAPELILTPGVYSESIDVWSVGCILAELLSMEEKSCPLFYDRKPLFPGKSCAFLSPHPSIPDDSRDQLNVILEVLGTPSADDIAAIQDPKIRNYVQSLPSKSPVSFSKLYPGADPEAIHLLTNMLRFSPHERLTVDQALAHPFLAQVRDLSKELVASNPVAFEFENVPLTANSLRALIYKEILAFNESKPASAPQSSPPKPAAAVHSSSSTSSSPSSSLPVPSPQSKERSHSVSSNLSLESEESLDDR
eukprot:GILI01006171.1.p1 GENE.GILI01006171.1~~GILI01006171.1.p1  ORF type:complete len:646 (-),score=111.79 GILI01006171.1:224-2161(-)